MPSFAAATLRCLAFLTRIDVPMRIFPDGHRLGDDAHTFPVAGLFIALPAALVILGGITLDLSSLSVAVLALGATVYLTGALHEDGLGDVADGIGGHHPRERALEIMEDSRVGAYGAIALILIILLRVALLADIVAASEYGAALAYPGVAAASRGIMAWFWSALPSARPGGLADRVGGPSKATGRLALLLSGAIFVIAGGVVAGLSGMLLSALLTAAAALWFRSVCRRRLGGQTGDTLGAMQQISEVALLLGLAVVL